MLEFFLQLFIRIVASGAPSIEVNTYWRLSRQASRL